MGRGLTASPRREIQMDKITRNTVREAVIDKRLEAKWQAEYLVECADDFDRQCQGFTNEQWVGGMLSHIERLQSRAEAATKILNETVGMLKMLQTIERDEAAKKLEEERENK